ncbi:MAG: TolC family protein, partial [Fusobacteriaceae bacterium]
FSFLVFINSLALGRTLTLEEAIDLSIEKSREIKIAEKDLEISRKNVSSAFKLALPSVVYSGQYQKGENERWIGMERTIKDKSGYTQSLGISQPIFQGGTVIGAIKGAKVYQSTANLQYLASKRDIRLEVVDIYSSIIKNNRDIEAFKASEKELLARYDRQKIQFEMRLIVKTDLLKTEYSLLDIEAKREKAKNEIKILKENLKLKLRIPSDEEIELKEFQVKNSLTELIDYEADLKQAKEGSIASLLAQNSVELSEIEKIRKRADMLPKIDGFMKFGTYAEQQKYSETVDDGEWRGGISVNWNVFQFGKDYDLYSASKIESEKQVLNREIAKDNIELNLNSAYLNMINLENIKASQYKAMKAAEENFMMDTERYEAGIITTVDYLNSETQLREARVAYNSTIDEYYLAFEKYRSILI